MPQYRVRKAHIRALATLVLLVAARTAFGQPFTATGAGGSIADSSVTPFDVQLPSGLEEICSLELDITGLSHDAPMDLDIFLISPFGGSIEIMTDRGDGGAVYGVELTFSDGAGGPPPQTGPLVSGTFQPEGLANGSDDGLGTYDGSSGGSDAWTLLVIDDAAGDTGSFVSFTIRGENGPGYCSPVTFGACCDREAGTCQEGVEESACPEQGINWVEGAACDPDPFSIPCAASACCTPDDTCVNLTEEECLAVPPVYEPRLWQGGELCGVGGQVCPNSACIGRTGSCLEGRDRFCDGGFNDGQLCSSDSGCRSRCVSNVCDPGGGACTSSLDCNDDGQCVIGPGGMPECEGGARDGEFCDPDLGDRECLEAFCRLSPGCEAPTCCTAVCDYGPGFPLFTEFCCNVEWDIQCAELARYLCTGACCAEDAGEAVCTDGLGFDECSALSGTLFVDQSCSELDTAGGCPGFGACCDQSLPGGRCASDVPESQCDTANPQIVWYEGEDCVEDGGTIDCPEHTGACCDRSVPGGACDSGVPESQCQTSDPQVLWFKGEDCVEDGGAIECLEHTGACCDGNDGTCADDVPESQCDTADPQFTWFKATLCDVLDPPCAQHRGACCDRIAGACIDDALPDDCRNVNPGDQLAWFKSTPCSEVDCTEAVGACCDRDAGPLAETGLCTNSVAFADCQCPTCEWSKGRTCDALISEGSCEADFAAIPATTEWGLVILTLLLLTAAKVHGFGHTTAHDGR